MAILDLKKKEYLSLFSTSDNCILLEWLDREKMKHIELRIEPLPGTLVYPLLIFYSSQKVGGKPKRQMLIRHIPFIFTIIQYQEKNLY